ncbi:MAG: bifunctional hydroxymethylpyrimidine kinase/phosphomethylpyrimidine kinase [Alkalibacterium sp.]|nr:bifunctional hydroxymethylpyrimidine kinase/phosphomethylpyrimidine kinase [Tetragenococcus koreensis]MDN6295880.1 bifunctional hydroxymethylpyrimidine kinase/phosphomethylpyrimidine kinase [Alkalibacterium sp.]
MMIELKRKRKNMRENKVLLVSDFVGVGKVALSTMIPILNIMEADVSYLPTAVISNNFDYGKVVVKELTDFMKDNKNTWKELDFQFDTITTGILMNPQQVEIVKEIINYHDRKPFIISDPIMGENGEIYPGLSNDLVEASRLMALEADLIIPNLTEFCLIVGRDYPCTDELNHTQLVSWLEKAKDKGVKSAIITSVKIEDEYYVYGYSEEESIFRVKIDYVPVEVGGTGDIFTSLIT